MQREVILVLGQTGSGKSYLAREIARNHPRVLVAGAGFDDYAPIAQVPDYEALLSQLDAHGAFRGRPFRLVYDFGYGELDLAFSTALECRDCLLILEEADRFDFSADYWEALYRGRHYGVSLLFIGLQATAIPTDVRRQVTRLYAFRQVFPDDVDWLGKIVGEEAYKLPELSGPPLPPPHPYLLWTPQDGARIVHPAGADAQGSRAAPAARNFGPTVTGSIAPSVKESKKAPAPIPAREQ